MGQLFRKPELPKNLVSFPLAVDHFVQGGDLIFIQDISYFDDYTRMNSQTLHIFKQCLRMKSDIKNFDLVNQWCRVAIVIDSDIEEIKYVLELTPEGFVKTEYVQRALLLRHENKIFGIKRLITPLTPEQSLRLRQIADQLTSKLSVASKNYGRIFDTSVFDETAADFKKPKQQIKKVKFGREKSNDLVFGKEIGEDSDEESI